MLPVEMIPASELPVNELTDTELDAVCGGFLNNFLNFGIVTQTNTAVPVAVNLGSGASNIIQAIGQGNFSFI